MFDNDIYIYGEHADMLKELTAPIDAEGKVSLFERNVDVYIIAPLIGCLYGERSSIRKIENDKTKRITINFSTVSREKSTLEFVYKLVMLLDKKYDFKTKKYIFKFEYESPVEDRLNSAFRNVGENQDDIERFDAYVRGGIDVLHRNLIDQDVRADEIIANLFDFCHEFQENYNEKIDFDNLRKLLNE